MSDRLRFIFHKGKRILLADVTNCSAAEVEKFIRAIPEIVTAQPLRSVLILSDFTGSAFDSEAVRTMKETAVFDKPYIKKSAWVGAEYLPPELSNQMKKFARREFPAFENREDALTWLTED